MEEKIMENHAQLNIIMYYKKIRIGKINFYVYKFFKNIHDIFYCSFI